MRTASVESRGGKIMKSLALLIKPASGACNMDCRYCFYHDLSKVKQHPSFGMMAESTMETIVKKAYAFADQSVTFGFQGGEPTLRGLDFYRHCVSCVEKYNTKRVPTFFTLQTNGTLIDREWAEFLGKYRFLVGLSMDGFPQIHDANRPDSTGKGTFDRVMGAAVLLRQYQVDFNILCVVTQDIAENGPGVYNFFKSNGFRYLQFIPCLDSLAQKPGSNPYSLRPRSYGKFLIDIFKLWYRDLRRGEYTSIRIFDNLVLMLKGQAPESCDLTGQCARGTVFEADGSMYPCDFYVMDEWRLGNILEEDFDVILSKQRADEFVSSSRNIAEECKTCKFRACCRSGCRRHKEPCIPGQPLKNYFCEAYKMFFAYALPDLKEIASRIR